MTTRQRYGHRSGHRNTRPACTSRNAYGAGVVLIVEADRYMWVALFSAPDKRPGQSCRDRGSALWGFNPHTPIEVFADLELRRDDSASLRRTDQRQIDPLLTPTTPPEKVTNYTRARGIEHPMRHTPTQEIGYCPHGAYPCQGDRDHGLPPCPTSDHHYCAHGFDQRLQTEDREPRCPYCRGITRRQRNRDTYNPRRRMTVE